MKISMKKMNITMTIMIKKISSKKTIMNKTMLKMNKIMMLMDKMMMLMDGNLLFTFRAPKPSAQNMKVPGFGKFFLSKVPTFIFCAAVCGSDGALKVKS